MSGPYEYEGLWKRWWRGWRRRRQKEEREHPSRR